MAYIRGAKETISTVIHLLALCQLLPENIEFPLLFLLSHINRTQLPSFANTLPIVARRDRVEELLDLRFV